MFTAKCDSPRMLRSLSYSLLSAAELRDGIINLGISGDRAENVLWRAREIPFLLSLKNVVILCGTNNINKDSPYDIAQDLIAVGSAFKSQPSNPKIFICGILPRDGSCSINRLIIKRLIPKKILKFFKFLKNCFSANLNIENSYSNH